MRLSYSKYKYYISCPKRYYNEEFKVDYPERDSRYFALYGFLIELFFKNYCNVYTKRKDPLLNKEKYAILRKMWDQILDEYYVDWTDPWVKSSSDQIFDQVLSDIDKNIEAFDFWDKAKSEVSFEIFLKKTKDIISCRMDFIVNRDDGIVEILDGKGTNKMDRVDVEQLYFYIFVYYLHYKKLPDKAGFVFYKFQHIQYIDFDMETITNFRKKLSLVRGAIKKDTEFNAKVGISKQCKWCPYRSTCKELIDKRSERASKKKNKLVIPVDFDGEVKSFSPRGLFV